MGTSSDLTTIDGVQAYLQNTDYPSHTVSALSGGSGNYAYRIHLTKPLDGHHTLVLKHAQPFVKDARTIAFSLDRQMFEYEALKRVKAWLPTDSLVTVPVIYEFDPDRNVLIMEDCGAETLTLKDFMLQIGADASVSLAATVGSSLGNFIGAMHQWSRSNPDGILDFFLQNKQALQLSPWATYGRLVQTLKPGENDEVLPPLQNPPLQISDADLEVAKKVAMDVSGSMVAARDCFVMGDFWPGNIMVVLDGEKQLRKLFLLDWELAKPGLPGVEIGQLCAELHLVQRYVPAAESFATTVLDTFLRSYAAQASPDDALVRLALLHWGTHLVVWTPRVTTWADNKDKARSIVAEGVKLIVLAKKGSVENLTHSCVGSLVKG
ncbi:hypothetical protein H0H93_005785 [Arthromyces matolae]|nr:hypothetical protein H0H93_005785 [Arthromyces matolae]